MGRHAFLFPGQGSQAVGMGRDLAAAFRAAREVFQEVDDTLSQRLSKLMFEGPAEELTLTANAQPALMAVSLAVLRVLTREGGLRLEDQAVFLAGHSLGEYSALTAAGVFDLATAARLLRVRGDAMQAAVPPGLGAMAALLGVSFDDAVAICAEAEAGEVVQPANDNGGGQVVISGHAGAVDRAIELAKARGFRRAMKLPVSAPFHCALMQNAAVAMAAALAEVGFAAPCVPVVANVSAAAETDPARLRDLLVAQVTGTVRWRESMEMMAGAGVESFVELGAGKVLSGLTRRLLPEARAVSVGNPAEIEALLTQLQA